jgi:hypothetical protein
MPRILRYLLTIVIALTALLVIAIMRGVKTELASMASYVYVLSSDARSTTINLSTGRVAASGQFTELRSIDRVYPNPFGGDLFVQSPGFQDTQGSQPTEQLAVLTKSLNGAGSTLRFARWIHGPTASSSVVWAKALSKDLLLVSRYDEQGRVTAVLYNTGQFEPLHVIENFLVTPTTCLGSDGQTVYAVSNNPKHEIRVLNLKSLEVKNSTYDQLGSPAAYYKAPLAADGCTIVFIERIQGPTEGSAPATIYVHNVETNTTLNKFNIDGLGQFALVVKRNLLLMDVTALVPNTVGGKTIGMRRMATGNLILYDTKTGKEAARISVPGKGELAGVSSDGSTAYYLSPKLLTVIDLVSGRVSAKIDLPFQRGIFVGESLVTK